MTSIPSALEVARPMVENIDEKATSTPDQGQDPRLKQDQEHLGNQDQEHQDPLLKQDQEHQGHQGQDPRLKQDQEHQGQAPRAGSRPVATRVVAKLTNKTRARPKVVKKNRIRKLTGRNYGMHHERHTKTKNIKDIKNTVSDILVQALTSTGQGQDPCVTRKGQCPGASQTAAGTAGIPILAMAALQHGAIKLGKRGTR